MNNIDKKTSWFALIVGQMCGAVDIAALPVWVGTLIAGFGMSPAQAGGLATVFLGVAVLTSIVIAPRFHKVNPRALAPLGFWITTAGFVGLTQVSGFMPYLLLHAVGGVGVGMALSSVSGTMGHVSNPHKCFALGGFGIGVAAIIYIVVATQLIMTFGPDMLWWTFAGVMAFGAIVTTLLFPNFRSERQATERPEPFTRTVWLAIGGLMAMGVNFGMLISFAERAGVEGGYGEEAVQLALISMAFLAILPPVLAGVLQHRIAALKMAMCMCFTQAAVGVWLMTATSYPWYFGALLLMPFSFAIANTFIFGLLARTETTGRATAATPVIVMGGSAIGPFLGGVIVQIAGFAAVGYVAIVIGCIALFLFYNARNVPQQVPLEA